jgi:hypothetical protein
VTTTGTHEQVRPRYGRITAFAGAVVSTLVTVSAGIGLLPSGGAPAQAAPHGGEGGAISLSGVEASLAPAADASAVQRSIPTTSGPSDGGEPAALIRSAADRSVALPARSGQGRRVVFDMSRQRVWLVDEADKGDEGDEGEEVLRSYLVSGSELDNLGPGTYEVYSRSRHATGIDGSSMDFMVRFTTGDNAPIGFHDIPEMDGEPVQTRAQLGTPLSHGCVRQARPDAVALWRFAPVGTTVVVTA